MCNHYLVLENFRMYILHDFEHIFIFILPHLIHNNKVTMIYVEVKISGTESRFERKIIFISEYGKPNPIF